MPGPISLVVFFLMASTDAGDPRRGDASRLMLSANVAFDAGKFSESEQAFARAFELSNETDAAYGAACAAARGGRKQEALAWIEKVGTSDFEDSAHLASDPDLASIREDARFRRVMAQVAKRDANLKAKLPKLREALMKRGEIDQVARRKIGSGDPKLGEQIAKIDRDNTEWLKGVIAEHGWPGKALVGPRAGVMAFLLVQHADHDPAFQEKTLPLLEASAKKGEVRAQDVAYLTDRVRVNTGRPQLYGTQFMAKPDGGGMMPKPIEDEANVDARRASVGLEPLAQYALVIARMQSAHRAPVAGTPDGGH
jgi:hypothetical protein